MSKHKSRFEETKKCGNSKLYKAVGEMHPPKSGQSKRRNEMNEFIVRVSTPLRQAKKKKKLKQFSLSFENFEIDEIHMYI